MGETNESESHAGAGGRVLIFGIESHSEELARTLEEEGFDVTLVGMGGGVMTSVDYEFAEEMYLESLADEEIGRLFDEPVVGVVAMLDDDDSNEAILRFASERHGVPRLVVRPGSVTEKTRFEDRGA